MRFTICLLTVLFIGLIGPILALATAKPQAGEILLVVGPDPVFLQAAVVNAGGRLIGPELARFGMLVIAESEQFTSEILKQGAWIILDGRRLAHICGVEA